MIRKRYLKLGRYDHESGNTDLATMGAILGFVVMMMLDVAFG
jgi:zinc transporter ZupT